MNDRRLTITEEGKTVWMLHEDDGCADVKEDLLILMAAHDKDVAPCDTTWMLANYINAWVKKELTDDGINCEKVTELRVIRLIHWGWVDFFRDLKPEDIVNELLKTDYWDCPVERGRWAATEMVHNLNLYISRVHKRSGIMWHYESCSSTTANNVRVKLSASGGHSRKLYWNGHRWSIS